MKRSLVALVAALMSLVTVGCGERTARLYNLTTGEVTTITYAGKKLTGTLPSGEHIAGEYVTVVEGTTTWGSIYSSVYGSYGTKPVSFQDRTTVIGHQSANTAKGSAIATGDKGTIIQCEYLTSATAGHGACEDNHATKYKLMF